MADQDHLPDNGPYPLPPTHIARLPAPGDNLAIATRTLAAGTRIEHDGRVFVLDYGVLEGHRFAVQPIAAGESLLSWGLPFGRALRDIAAGEYAANAAMLEALSGRGLPFALPAEPNFQRRADRRTYWTRPRFRRASRWRRAAARDFRGLPARAGARRGHAQHHRAAGDNLARGRLCDGCWKRG